MTQNDPAKRPSIDEAIARFDTLLHDLNRWIYTDRFRRRGVEAPKGVLSVVNHSVQIAGYILSGRGALPQLDPDAKPLFT